MVIRPLSRTGKVDNKYKDLFKLFVKRVETPIFLFNRKTNLNRTYICINEVLLYCESGQKIEFLKY